MRSLNVEAIEVRSIEELNQVDGLIIPGGESTVIARFLEETGVGNEIIRRTQRGIATRSAEKFTQNQRGILPAGTKKNNHPLAIYGTCAGAIVLAKEATGKNAPRTLDLIDITIDRNAYGTQVDSFETTICVNGFAASVSQSRTGSRRDVRSDVSTGTRSINIPVSFIRAPKITRVGKDVEILAKHKGLPVLVRQGSVLVGTFHPEVRGETRIHEMFIQMIQ